MTTKKKQPKDTTIENLCFVVGPIGEEGSETRTKANWLLKGIIKPVLEPRGYTVKRADEMPVPGNIDTQVINTVIDAELVIADLSELNANAFYELGLRHMSPNRPVIHMMRHGERIPFDNTSFRTVWFDHESFEGMQKAKASLEKQLDEIEKDGFKVETPVSRARAVNDVKFEGSDFEKTIQAELSELKNEVNRLRNVTVKKWPEGRVIDDSEDGEEFFFIGDHVEHPKFGQGEVYRIEGDKIYVDFDDTRRKVLKHFLKRAPNPMDDEIPF